MAYPYYDARNTVPSTPAEDWVDDLQAIVDSEFENASTYYTIQEEVTVGSGTWQNTEARINHIVYSDTGEKLGDDYKSIIFQDFTHARAMGYAYYFDTNVWITINSDQKKYVTASSVIRRCNNILQKRDINGVLIQQPCIIDYGISRDNFGMGQAITLPDGVIEVTAQNNTKSIQFNIDDRVLFGGQAFRVESIQNFRNNTTYGNNDNPLIVWRMGKINTNALDDITNNIADNTNNVYTLTINQDDFNQIVSYSSTLSATVKLNGEVISEGVTWSSSAPTKVSVGASTGIITCLAVGSATITAKMTDNALVLDTIAITVVASVTPTNEIRILPNITYLNQGDPAQVYTVYKYENNVVQADTFTFTTSGATIENYEAIVISGNSFSIRNIGQDDNALVVLCTNNTDASTKTLNVELGGLW